MHDDAKLAAIADEVARLTGYPLNAIHSTTRVYHDAGLSGLDYQEFLLWLSNKYEVDLSGMDMKKLCPSEGGVGSLWSKRYLEMTVQDYATLAEASSWKMSGLEDRVALK